MYVRVIGGPAVGAETLTDAAHTVKLNIADVNQCVHVTLYSMYLILQVNSQRMVVGWYFLQKMITLLINGQEPEWEA